MNTRGIKLTKAEDFSNGGPILCTGVKPDKAYVDGKPTDQICGTRYDVVFPANGYVRAIIKTPRTEAGIYRGRSRSHRSGRRDHPR